MDEKQLKLLLVFGSDASKIQEDMKRTQGRIEELRKQAQTLQETLKIHRAVGKDTDHLEKSLKDVTGELGTLEKKAQDAQTSLRGMSNSSRDIRDNLFNIRDMGRSLQEVGRGFRSFGQAILSPLSGAMQSYLQNNPFDVAAVAWQSAQQRIESAFVRIGAVATKELTPAIQKAADLVEKIADVIEKNPELVKAGLLLGGGLVGLGSVAQMAGQLAMLIGVFKGLNLSALLGGAASVGKTIGGLAAGAGGSALGGIGLGLAGYGALAKSEVGQRAGLANLGQYASVAAYYSGKIFGEDTAKRWFLWMGQMTGVIERQAEAVQQNTMVTQQQLSAFEAYEQAQQQRTEYERKAQAERSQIIAEFAQQRAELERNYQTERASLIAQYGAQRAKMMRDFARTERQAEQDYYQNRLKIAQNYQVDVQRGEEDHQRRMRQLSLDHEERLQELIENRDALGIVKERRSYERRRQEEEEGYRVQAARRSEDFARQIQETEAQFAIQRQRRLEDFQIQMADLASQQQQRLAQLDAQHQEELKRLNEQQRKRLQQFDRQYQEELRQLQNAEKNRLNILRMLALNDQSELQRTGMELTARYKAWLEQQAKSFSGGEIKRRAAGGNVRALTPYLVGEQGAELFVPDVSGTIVPHSMTRSMLADTQYGGGKMINMRVETSSLTLNQVMREVERRLAQRDRVLARALGG